MELADDDLGERVVVSKVVYAVNFDMDGAYLQNALPPNCSLTCQVIEGPTSVRRAELEGISIARHDYLNHPESCF